MKNNEIKTLTLYSLPINYQYDKIGRLIKDVSENIEIEWTADSKIKKITKLSPTPPFVAINYINYYYDANGNRVAKTTTYENEEAVPLGIFYMKDASGNTICIYNNFSKNALYGTEYAGDLCITYTCPPAGCEIPEPGIACFGEGEWSYDPNTGKFTVYDFEADHFTCGIDGVFFEEYELYSDSRIFICSFSVNSEEVELPSTTGTSVAEYHHYGSSAQGRFATWKPENISYSTTTITPTNSSTLTRNVSQKEYEVKDHLGNVRLVFSDMKDVNFGQVGRNRYKLDIRSVNNYYPFGMLMPDMSWQSSGYRYGYNGMEMDNDIKGTGNHIIWGDFGYDPRIGRRYMLEPIIAKYPSLSPYVAYADNPMIFIITY